MSDMPFIQVEVTLRFQRNLRKLAKKYPKIHDDIQPVIKQLQMISKVLFLNMNLKIDTYPQKSVTSYPNSPIISRNRGKLKPMTLL